MPLVSEEVDKEEQSKESLLEDYKTVPVQGFGMGMLGGGWDRNQGRGSASLRSWMLSAWTQCFGLRDSAWEQSDLGKRTEE